MTPLQAQWEQILADHDLAEDRAAPNPYKAIQLSRYLDPGDGYNEMLSRIEEKNPFCLYRWNLAVPITHMSREQLVLIDWHAGMPSRTSWTDQRTKHYHNRWSSGAQAKRMLGKKLSEETKRKIGEANRVTWAAKTPEERSAIMAGRIYQNCPPGCTCSKHDPEMCERRRLAQIGKKHNVSEVGKARQDIARRRKMKGQMVLNLWAEDTLKDTLLVTAC